MSQYYQINDIGKLPIDALVQNPNCNTCGIAECYNKFTTLSGVTETVPNLYYINVNKQPYHYTSSLKSPGADLTSNDPYDVKSNTISGCEPLNANVPIHIPQFPINYEMNANIGHVARPIHQKKLNSPKLPSD